MSRETLVTISSMVWPVVDVLSSMWDSIPGMAVSRPTSYAAMIIAARMRP